MYHKPLKIRGIISHCAFYLHKKRATFHTQTTLKLNKLCRYTEKISKSDKQITIHLILDFVGETHAPRFRRAFSLSDIGAEVSWLTVSTKLISFLFPRSSVGIHT